MTRYEPQPGILGAPPPLARSLPDAVFTFSRPVTGGYYWFLPLRSGKLDLSALGIEG